LFFCIRHILREGRPGGNVSNQELLHAKASPFSYSAAILRLLHELRREYRPIDPAELLSSGSLQSYEDRP
jgi:hypothetical protein